MQISSHAVISIVLLSLAACGDDGPVAPPAPSGLSALPAAWVSDDGSFRSITGMAADGAGGLLVVDSLGRSLTYVDAADGTRSIRRESGHRPRAGACVSAERGLERSVMAVDIESGDRVFVSN